MTKIADLSQDSSSSFGKDNEESRVRKFAKHMLKSNLFIGTFQEKRFVEPLNSYRDVIKVANDETDMIDNLVAVRKRLVKYFSKGVWIGITEPKTIGAPAGYNLWVSLDEEVFGSYWFKVKTVQFYENEVRLRLEVVRPVAREETTVHNITPQQILEDISEHDISELSTRLSNFFKEKATQLFTETFSFSNIKEATIFILLLITTLITFLIQTTKYFLDYFLKLVHEFSGLVKACTPIITNLINLIANIVNGFYSLVAIMWRDRSTPKIEHNVYQILPYERQFHNKYRALPSSYQEDFPRQRSLYGNRRSQPKIIPLD